MKFKVKNDLYRYLTLRGKLKILFNNVDYFIIFS